jgi:hypothetical protein
LSDGEVCSGARFAEIVGPCPAAHRLRNRLHIAGKGYLTPVFVFLIRLVDYDTSVRFEVFTAVTMKNDFFWDMKKQFVPQRRHITLHYRAQPVNAM